jgi:dienelactone hydrolase
MDIGGQWFPQRADWAANATRLVAEALGGGGDIEEIFQVSRRLADRTDDAAWCQAWADLAGDCWNLAEAAAGQGHYATATAAYLRACNYFRQAEFYLPAGDPNKMRWYDALEAAFQRATAWLQPRVETVAIPYGDVRLKGYWCHPPTEVARPAPAVLLLGGADSLAEELYFVGRGIVERGAYLLLVDTPGRGAALRRPGLTAPAAYEEPGRAVLDWLEAQPGVDRQRIGLWGISMAGYYAPRVAAADRRVQAMVLNCGCYDVLANLYDYYPALQAQLAWVVGAHSDAEARQRLAAFNLREAAPRITCPTFVVHGEDDAIMDVQGARDLYAALSCPKSLHIWPKGTPGATHCSWDNYWAASVEQMDWLMDHLVGKAR